MVSEPLLVMEDLSLEPGVILTRPLVILAHGITIEGNGATIQGPGIAGNLSSFKGAGITSKGFSGVTIKNLMISGFAAGFRAENGEGWIIEGCDFSDNFHNPEHGWGEGDRAGGIVLTAMSDCRIVNNRANRVWNACDLRDCHNNEIRANDFSHASNTCLKLWNSCRNRIVENDLSYGIRIKPGEVHARDSASLLLESGSNDNHVERNDLRHGGDGIFIRVLNDWVSTGNAFVENDCSFANNNCVECWAPGNVFTRNKANHGSYGFWMGGSDRSVLVENEAAYNGVPEGNHNAPEPGFAHGGIVFVNGTSYHTKLIGNHCHHNNGGGIVLRGDLKSQGKRWKAQHWVIMNNHLEHNQWGIYAQYADWLFLSGNRSSENREPDFFEDVSRITRIRREAEGDLHVATLQCPTVVTVGQEVLFDASSSLGRNLAYEWDFSGSPSAEALVSRIFTEPGFCRVGLTVRTETEADLASADLYITSPSEAPCTENAAHRWRFEAQLPDSGKDETYDPEVRAHVSFFDDHEAFLVGRNALGARVEPYSGERIVLSVVLDDTLRQAIGTAKGLRFWMKRQNENVHGFRGPNPILRLHARDGIMAFIPKNDANFLSADESYSEARWGWLLVTVQFEHDAHLRAETVGSFRLADTERLSIELQSHGCRPFTVWIDGLTLEQ